MSATPFTVTGTVVNGLNGSPIPRALVRLNTRSAMTDHLGHFVFPQFVGTNGSVQVTRPGYASSPDDPGTLGRTQSVDLTGSLELKLYPDAILTGTVTGSDRLPIEHVQVILMRETTDENGSRLAPAGFLQTDTHGEFRFNEPPGRYRINLPFSARADTEGSVMLPAEYPENSSGETPATFVAASNADLRIDLHARTATAYPVQFRVESGDGNEARYNPRMTVKSSTGASFSLFAHSASEAGVFELQLPSGSYQLRAVTETRDGRQEADAHVTVAGKPVGGLVLRFAPVPSIPVDLAVQASATGASSTTATQPPRLSSLGLRLQNVAQTDQFQTGDIGVGNAEGDRTGLQVSPGVYRLRAQYASQWYVRSATYGGVNLLTQPMTVSNGAAGEPIRLVVANDTGQVTGKVTGPLSHSSCFVYLVAHQPGLLPVVLAQSAETGGGFSRVLPPGTYTAYAFDRRFPADLRNPAVTARLQAGTDLDVPASGKASLDVPVQSADDSR